MTLCMIFLDSGGLRLDWTVNVGNLIYGIVFLWLVAVAWGDFHWRLKNLEEWKIEHSTYTRKQEEIIERMDKLLIRMEQFIGMTDQRKMGTIQTRKDD